MAKGQFPPIRLQETDNLASRPFKLEAKVQGRHNLECLHANTC